MVVYFYVLEKVWKIIKLGYLFKLVRKDGVLEKLE